MLIRPATTADWDAIWPFFHEITRAGETYPYDYDMPEPQAASMWLAGPPDHAVIAVDDDDVLGTAKMGPNKAGGGAHISTASFMVDPSAFGRGVGRALALDPRGRVTRSRGG